jgi:hypothetical protein
MVELAIATAKYPNIIGSDAAFRKIRREFAAVRSGERRSTLLITGDSTNAGKGSGAGDANLENGARAKRPVAVMANILNSMGIPARADATTGRQGIAPSTVAHYTEYNPDVTFGATWAFAAPEGIGGGMMSEASPNTGAMAFTPKRDADRFDILYPRGGSFGAITVSDSGGTLTGGSISMTGANAMLLSSTSRVTASTTPVNIARASGGTVYVNAIIPWNSTLPEFCIVDGSAIGWRASNYTDTSQYWSPRNSLSPIAANLHYIELGLNDISLGDTLSTYLTNLETWVDLCQAQSGANSAILGISAPGDGSYALPIDWRSGIADLARDKDIVLVDHFSRFVSRAADTSLYSDNVHLTAPGSAMKGALLASLALI